MTGPMQILIRALDQLKTSFSGERRHLLTWEETDD
jgi:hypothetical protein